MLMNSQIERHVTQLATQLQQKNWSIACAESCTGGGIAYALTSISGSSAWFAQSWVTYSNQAKHDLVSVPLDTLEKYGAVSRQTVQAMAQGAARKAEAELAIAVSGIAGPSGGTKEKPVGLVWFGIFLSGSVACEQQIFSGDRHAIREQAILHALTILNQSLVVA